MKSFRVVAALVLLLTQALPLAGAGLCRLGLGHHHGCPVSLPSTTLVMSSDARPQSTGCMNTPVCDLGLTARPELPVVLEFVPTPEHNIVFAVCDRLSSDSRSPPLHPPDPAAA